MTDQTREQLERLADQLRAVESSPSVQLTPRQRDTLRRLAVRLHRWLDEPATGSRVPAGYLTRAAFARAAGVSLNTLLAWHKAGRLVPAYIDPVNGWRYYTPEQLPQTRTARQRRTRKQGSAGA